MSALKVDEHFLDTHLKVAVLGPLGTFTHEAALQRFGSYVYYDEQDTIKDVFDALPSMSCVGVVPHENTIFGGVIETYDVLREVGFVRGDITLQVQHCLLVRQGVHLGDIRRVFSHEQALGQCHEFIKAHLPTASLIKTTSTAAAARALLDNPPDSAAICSRVCATLFNGLSVLQEGIQNVSSNFTRFYIVTRNEEGTLPLWLLENRPCKALLRISTKVPSSPSKGDISQLLSVLNMNVTRIDRRPSLGIVPFHDIYFVEIRREEKTPALSDAEGVWRREIESAMERVMEGGGTVQLIGIW